MPLGAIGVGHRVGAVFAYFPLCLAPATKKKQKCPWPDNYPLCAFGLAAALAGYFYLRPLLAFWGNGRNPLAEEYLSVITSGAVMFFSHYDP